MPPVSGISLEVLSNGLGEPRTLEFRKVDTPVVSIGRRPAARNGVVSPVSASGDGATFRCPVISRRHAQIAYSNDGEVYVIDLKSHHGTWLLRGGQPAPFRIDAHVPVTLGENDVVTFGKLVNKDGKFVEPIAVRIHLRREAPSTPSALPPPPPATTAPAAMAATPSGSSDTPSRRRWGRFGLDIPSSFSTDSSAPPSDTDDIEEIPRPPGAAPARDVVDLTQDDPPAPAPAPVSAGAVLDAPPLAPPSQSSRIPGLASPLGALPLPARMPALPAPCGGALGARLPSIQGLLRAPWVHECAIDLAPIDMELDSDAEGAPAAHAGAKGEGDMELDSNNGDVSDEEDEDEDEDDEDEEDEDEDEDEDKSPAPVGLLPPGLIPARDPFQSLADFQPAPIYDADFERFFCAPFTIDSVIQRPPMIHLMPPVPPQPPLPPPSSVEHNFGIPNSTAGQAAGMAAGPSNAQGSSIMVVNRPLFSPSPLAEAGSPPPRAQSVESTPSVVTGETSSNTSEMAEIRSALMKAEHDIVLLQIQRRRIKARLARHVSDVDTHLAELERRTMEIQSTHDDLALDVNATEATVDRRFEALFDRTDDHSQRMDDILDRLVDLENQLDERREIEREDVNVYNEQLKQLIAATIELRDTSKQQFTDELATMRALRAEVTATATAATGAPAGAATPAAENEFVVNAEPPRATLKRKRPAADPDADAPTDEAPDPPDAKAARPRKRLRRAAKAILHTVAAAAAGALATVVVLSLE